MQACGYIYLLVRETQVQRLQSCKLVAAGLHLSCVSQQGKGEPRPRAGTRHVMRTSDPTAIALVDTCHEPARKTGLKLVIKLVLYVVQQPRRLYLRTRLSVFISVYAACGRAIWAAEWVCEGENRVSEPAGDPLSILAAVVCGKHIL